MTENCLEVVKRRGNSLWGYSPDTLMTLYNVEGNEDQCLSLFMWLESVYG